MEKAIALYLEDIEVGQTFESSSHVLTIEEIKEFAGRYDPQFFHLDEELAVESLFGGLAASGWHTAATTMRLLVQSVPFARGLVGAGGEISWPRATRPGDAIRLRSEVTAVTPSRSRPERGMVTLRCETVNQDGELVQVFSPKIVAWSKEGSDANFAVGSPSAAVLRRSNEG
ncbi:MULTISPECIES: MaoC family dehydratase [Alphaproteobacteria]|uniref:MaoC family dehydratase n=3 Tax=Alphaproteobacteria TaxID=28211 RepID=A0A512HH40_9HYPH|nr:MaoC family dehydratase [Sphingomonas psychrolutea]GEO84773.1 MaoC family dehydratase [Ciceribacter naphthalenivorans]GLR20606.1 MaoC family dehydratase [Ciceribacter naphthalenivorans]GLT03462.1 MaoC family dehydratase [Sphingomonas psychrolutea]